METEGYSRLAMLMGTHPALSICRKFMTLNAYVVLSLQAELLDLEDDLAQIAYQDRRSKDREDKLSFHSSFLKLRAAVSDPVRGYQWSKIGEIKAKLIEYDAARTRFRELASSPPVNKRNLEVVRYWLADKTGGSHSISGIEAEPWWEEKYKQDLVSLLPEDKNKDAFSKWIEDTVVHFYHGKLAGHRLNSPVILPEAADLPQPFLEYSARRISNAIDAFVTIISSLLPTLPFFTLYYIHSPLGKMGAIMAFTFLFSVVLKLVAKVRRIDCFMAATAYAAVQVVFLSMGPVTPSS